MGGFAPKGRARVDPQRPAAFAICEMCGFMYNHRDLKWEMQYQGNKIERTGHLVCDRCWDVPNPTLRPIVLPPDPVPILNPRPEKVHVHVFISVDMLDPTADVAFRIYPPVDVPRAVSVDAGAANVGDTSTL